MLSLLSCLAIGKPSPQPFLSATAAASNCSALTPGGVAIDLAVLASGGSTESHDCTTANLLFHPPSLFPPELPTPFLVLRDIFCISMPCCVLYSWIPLSTFIFTTIATLPPPFFFPIFCC